MCTLLADSEKGIQAFKTKCLGKLLRISYLEHKTNDRVRNKNFLRGPQEPFSGNCQETETCIVRAYHALREPLQNHLSGRRRGPQRKCWMDNIKEWTSLPMLELLNMASCREYWKRISDESSLMSYRRPNRSKD